MSALPEFAAELAEGQAHRYEGEAAAPPGRTSRGLVKPRVVIVDEHQLLSDGVRRALEQNGVDVLGVATSANSAVDVLTREGADAVIFCMRTQSGLDRLPAPSAPPAHPPQRPTVSVFAPGLTSRERQVLRLLIEGASNKDMAKRLAIRSNTVRTHVQNLLAKLRVHTRLEAVTLAIRAGMLDTDENAAMQAVEP